LISLDLLLALQLPLQSFFVDFELETVVNSQYGDLLMQTDEEKTLTILQWRKER
jgi:hypothetical protein